MLIGPALSGDTRGKIGGAAGNRTRVQSAYYVRVYLHIPEKPDVFDIGRNSLQEKTPPSSLVRRDQGTTRESAREA